MLPVLALSSLVLLFEPLGGRVARAGARAAPSVRAVRMLASDGGGAAVFMRDLDVWAGANVLIGGIEWSINRNERWAIVGANGCGKSSLLREIVAAADDDAPDAELRVMPGLKLGVLEQASARAVGSPEDLRSICLRSRGEITSTRA